jgi:hypothetical protein
MNDDEGSITSKSVWVVDRGEFHHDIVGVFSSKENAELIAKRLECYVKVLEWPLNPAVEELKSGKKLYDVSVAMDGTLIEINEHADKADLLNCFFIDTILHPVTFNKIGSKLLGEVWATDEKHAIKIVNEKRLQLIAEGRWKK